MFGSQKRVQTNTIDPKAICEEGIVHLKSFENQLVAVVYSTGALKIFST